MSKKVLSFHYTLKNDAGKTLDSSVGQEPLAFLEDSRQIIPGLEKVLITLKVGDKKTVKVPAADAYGKRDEKLLTKASPKQLPAKNVKLGDMFRGGNDHHSPVFTVTAVTETEITLDGNHPLAGQDLTFDVEMMEIRAATAEELSHGHVHGAGGHHH